MKLYRFLGATALAGTFLVNPAIVLAQKADKPAATTAPAASDDDDKNVIVVTGSRIGRSALDSPAPITIRSADDLLDRGQINLGDALNDLPQLRATFSQANSTRFIGTSGLSILDLRGLGTARTLVLVNGRRHVTSVPGSYSVDVNTIPADLLDGVEVVTGGNSAVYGSDAIAGVVNFKLKTDFEGLKIQGQGGASQRGDRGSYFASGVYGRNFNEGRGNIAIAGEFSRLNPLFFIDRPDQTGAYNGRSQFNLSQNPALEPPGGNGIPDLQFFTNVRNGTIFDGGGLNAICNATVATDITRCRQSPNAATTTLRGQRYAFNSAGQLVLSNPSLDFRDITGGGSSNTVGGLGSTLRNTGQLNPLNQRYSFNLVGHYDFSDLLGVFVEGKYVKYKVNQEGQPSFSTGFGALTNNVSCSNGFLQASALATLQSIGYCATPTGVFPINRFNVDFGGRGELQNRELYRIVGGFKGTFNDNWKYELAFNYGHYSSFLRSLNNLRLFDLNGNPDGYLLAANAVTAPVGYTGSNFVLGPSGNKVICNVNAGVGGNVRPDCVPINLFGVGAPSQAALNFVNTTATRVQRASEFDATFNLTGDLGKYFTLPGGPVKFNVGAEYRAETAFAQYDPLTKSGGTFLNAIADFTPPAQKTVEGFGEIELPILKDVPFAKEFTLSAATRYSSYNSKTGGVWSYNIGGVWAPIRDLRFRGSYAVAVRAPTQSNLYLSPSQNFAFVTDPCDVLAINTGGPNRIANCQAAGIPNLATFANTPFRQQSQGFLNAGNPNLLAETGKSFTVGFVAEPKGLRGLSLTVDYYNIEVTNLIASLGLQTILNLCYDSPSLNNQYCALLQPRDPTTGFFPNGNVGTAAGVNFAKQRTSGIDAELNYTKRWDSGWKLNANVLFTYLFERTNFTNPANPAFGTAQLGNTGDPQTEGSLSLTVQSPHGLSLRYQLQYIGVQATTSVAFENTHTFQGRAPTYPNIASVTSYPQYTYSNIRLSQDIDNKKFQFYVGVDNLFNLYPPYGTLGTGSGDAIYQNYGRYFYSGFKINLGPNLR